MNENDTNFELKIHPTQMSPDDEEDAKVFGQALMDMVNECLSKGLKEETIFQSIMTTCFLTIVTNYDFKVLLQMIENSLKLLMEIGSKGEL